MAMSDEERMTWMDVPLFVVHQKPPWETHEFTERAFETPFLFCDRPRLSCSGVEHLCVARNTCHAPNPYNLRTLSSL